MTAAVALTNAAARVASWLLDRLDRVPCRWANETGDDRD